MIASPAVDHVRRLARTDPAVDWLLRVIAAQTEAIERLEDWSCAECDAYPSRDVNTDWPEPPPMPRSTP
jgi:hypothetical protein